MRLQNTKLLTSAKIYRGSYIYLKSWDYFRFNRKYIIYKRLCIRNFFLRWSWLQNIIVIVLFVQSIFSYIILRINLLGLRDEKNSHLFLDERIHSFIFIYRVIVWLVHILIDSWGQRKHFSLPLFSIQPKLTIYNGFMFPKFANPILDFIWIIFKHRFVNEYGIHITKVSRVNASEILLGGERN